MSDAPSGHLLRTLAAVPVTSKILVVGDDDGRHATALSRLGFELSVVDYAQLTDTSSDGFDWAIAYDAFPPADTPVEDVLDALVEIRRVLVSGGWLYVAIHTGNIEQSESDLILSQYQLMERAGFELAEKAEVITDQEQKLVRGIFRRVDADTAP